MKIKFLLFTLVVFIGVMNIQAALPQFYKIERDDALIIAQNQFIERDVDYYILNDNNGQYWTIFVDAQPLQNWSHECYRLTVPKFTLKPLAQTTPTNIESLKMFPSGDYQPLLVKDRYEDIVHRMPVVEQDEQISYNPEAQRTYAVILSGGGGPEHNAQRYWNDCSFIYQTLSKRYGVPKSQIFPLMADGANPGEDTNVMVGGEILYISQSLDLDNDGENEISLSATNSNLRQTLDNLLPKLNRDDHLLFYVIDHGWDQDETGSACILMWQYQKLYDYMLGDMLRPFCNNGVNVNVVLGQCYAGYFIDDLTEVGCVVSTASGYNPSHASSVYGYDEFVYRWTCALNGKDHNNIVLKDNPDLDGDGFVSMDEAFKYAKSHDKRSDEPHYLSTPSYVGERLAVDRIADGCDLFIQDSSDDNGTQTNETTATAWESDAIWVRNRRDNGFQHENPVYSDSHRTAFVNVRVHNRGKDDYNGGKWLQLYWAQASTALSADVWKGNEVAEGQYPTGGKLTPVHIPYVRANCDTIITVEWLLPAVAKKTMGDVFSCNLYARIQDHTSELATPAFSSLLNNKEAQRSLTVIENKDFNKFFDVYVRNTSDRTQAYSVELVTKSINDILMYRGDAYIEFELNDKFITAWQRGGNGSNDIQSVLGSNLSMCRMRALSEKAKFSGIVLDPGEFVKLRVRFVYTRSTNGCFNYEFDLVQRDSQKKIVGGNTVLVEGLSFNPNLIVITSTPNEGNTVVLSASSNQSLADVSWENEYGLYVGNTEEIVVMPTSREKQYTVTATGEDGVVLSSTILLDCEYGIQEVVNEGLQHLLEIEFVSSVPKNSYIHLVPTFAGQSISYPVEEGAHDVAISTEIMQEGLYEVCYYVNSVLVDSRRVNIMH